MAGQTYVSSLFLRPFEINKSVEFCHTAEVSLCYNDCVD